MPGDISIDEITWLRANSPAWRLLRAENAPLVLSFLHRVFVQGNARAISAADLEALLDDELYAIRQRNPDSFPKGARAYLDDWARPEAGWLRKYYPDGIDEPHFDATPAVEKALAWVRSLGEREFVGTESRLNTVFELLRQIVHGTEADPAARIEELTRRRQEIDDELERVLAGEVPLLDRSAVRDRYQQLTATAWELLSDFRQVEQNFRRLDRQLREKIAGWLRRRAVRPAGLASRARPRLLGRHRHPRPRHPQPGAPPLPPCPIHPDGRGHPARPPLPVGHRAGPDRRRPPP